MKTSRTLFLAVPLLALLLTATFLAGCTGGEGDTKPESLSVTGSTTVLPIAQKAAEAYMDTHPDADIQVSGGGSSVGVQAVGEGTADIGMASRDLKESEREKYPDLIQHVVARDGIAMIVHPSNTVEAMTIAQIKAIYQGTVTNWKDLGGPDMAIVVVGRDSASGTREFFQETVMNREDFVPTQLEKNSNGAVKQTIAQTPGAIGYVGLGYVDPSVKALKVDVNGTAVEPTVAAVVSGDYPIARSLTMVTKGEATGLAKEYLAFILSPEGQAIVEEEGFVPVA